MPMCGLDLFLEILQRLRPSEQLCDAVLRYNSKVRMEPASAHSFSTFAGISVPIHTKSKVNLWRILFLVLGHELKMNK